MRGVARVLFLAASTRDDQYGQQPLGVAGFVEVLQV